MSDFIVDHDQLTSLKDKIANAKSDLEAMADIDVSEGKIDNAKVEKAVTDFLFGVKSHKTRIVKGVEGMQTAIENALTSTTDADDQMQSAIRDDGSEG
ncbi:hypothetical protein EJ419_05035 [Alloscardovia theropitheci]|uniref:Uncharacterized protein n=1 Tax=Alloscardovia theropitheci TaxID=2496842 RepID=A0A4R0QWX2_9BIFI|nr:hypothetical protein [Alloscardovia theropitheci]TCD54030.1 hypothetical protein EJ419_05035 [Alloscardovia theropitheci]